MLDRSRQQAAGRTVTSSTTMAPRARSVSVGPAGPASTWSRIHRTSIRRTGRDRATRAGKRPTRITTAQSVTRAVPVVIHGDAAFPGQGVVAETLNLQTLDATSRRHAAPDHEQPDRLHHRTDDGRSTRWASDLAKGFDVPIIHVNADDVEGCIQATRLAYAFARSSATTR